MLVGLEVACQFCGGENIAEIDIYSYVTLEDLESSARVVNVMKKYEWIDEKAREVAFEIISRNSGHLSKEELKAIMREHGIVGKTLRELVFERVKRKLEAENIVLIEIQVQIPPERSISLLHFF